MKLIVDVDYIGELMVFKNGQVRVFPAQGVDLMIPDTNVGVGIEVRDNQLVALIWDERILEDEGFVETHVLIEDFETFINEQEQPRDGDD